MPRPTPSPVSRATGLLRGALAGARLAAPGGDGPGPAGMLRILAEELAAGHTDLRALAERWVAHYRSHPTDVDDETGTALEYLAAHGAPAPSGGGFGSSPLGRVLPVALVAADSPRTLVSATFHIAALTHPDPKPAWAAVAVNLAAARFVQGKRDFVPEVIEALRANPAPAELLAAVRRVPLTPRDHLPPSDVAGTDAVAAAEIALWLAYHEPVAARGIASLTGVGRAALGFAAAAGALLGARDGREAIPAAPVPEDMPSLGWDTLAERLAARPVPV